MFHVNSSLFLEQETKAKCGDKKLPASRSERRQNGEFVNFFFFFFYVRHTLAMCKALSTKGTSLFKKVHWTNDKNSPSAVGCPL